VTIAPSLESGHGVAVLAKGHEFTVGDDPAFDWLKRELKPRRLDLPLPQIVSFFDLSCEDRHFLWCFVPRSRLLVTYALLTARPAFDSVSTGVR